MEDSFQNFWVFLYRRQKLKLVARTQHLGSTRVFYRWSWNLAIFIILDFLDYVMGPRVEKIFGVRRRL